jgi:hypothetical protein
MITIIYVTLGLGFEESVVLLALGSTGVAG